MVFFDASALIAYLGGDEDVVEFVEARADERTVTIPLVYFEVYQGEVFKPSETDFDELDRRLSWLTVLDTDQTTARRAAEIQHRLHETGNALAPRDAFVAGGATAANEELAHRDGDFDSDAVRELVDVVEV